MDDLKSEEVDLEQGQKQSLLAPKTKQKEKKFDCLEPWHWFMDSPLERRAFGIFLMFGIASLLFALVFLADDFMGYLLSGITAIALSGYGANHFRILLGLKEQVDKYSKLNAQMQQENNELSLEVDRLEKASAELKTTEESNANKKLKENLIKFKELDDNLKKLGTSNIEGLEKIQKQSKLIMDKWKENLEKTERGIIAKVYDEFELDDNKDDMTEEEFDKFLNALPPEYVEASKKKNITFKKYASKDNLLQIDEFKKMLDVWVEHVCEEGGSTTDLFAKEKSRKN